MPKWKTGRQTNRYDNTAITNNSQLIRVCTFYGICCYLNIQWAYCQIHNIVGCACVGSAGGVSPPPRVSDPDMHHGACVTHVAWCMPGLLTTSLIWSWSRGKRSRHSRRMRNPQFHLSGKRPMIYGVDASLPCFFMVAVWLQWVIVNIIVHVMNITSSSLMLSICHSF